MEGTENLLERQQAEKILDLLTEAQVEVYDRVLLHMTSKEIARELDIAPNTVDQRVKAAWPKLGAHDRASAARRYALLKSICGQTTCGEPAIDFRLESRELLEQDLPDSPVFFVEDASSFESHFVEAQPTVLEALDERMGPLGRIVAILLAALVLATVALIITAVAVTLGDLV